MDIQLDATEREKKSLEKPGELFPPKASTHELKTEIPSGHGRPLDPEPAVSHNLLARVYCAKHLCCGQSNRKRRGKEVLYFPHLTVTLFG
jgi:hypothetical protein